MSTANKSKTASTKSAAAKLAELKAKDSAKVKAVVKTVAKVDGAGTGHEVQSGDTNVDPSVKAKIDATLPKYGNGQVNVRYADDADQLLERLSEFGRKARKYTKHMLRDLQDRDGDSPVDILQDYVEDMLEDVDGVTVKLVGFNVDVIMAGKNLGDIAYQTMDFVKLIVEYDGTTANVDGDSELTVDQLSAMLRNVIQIEIERNNFDYHENFEYVDDKLNLIAKKVLGISATENESFVLVATDATLYNRKEGKFVDGFASFVQLSKLGQRMSVVGKSIYNEASKRDAWSKAGATEESLMQQIDSEVAEIIGSESDK